MIDLEVVSDEAQLRLDIIHMHEQTLGVARTTLERALECGRLVHQLAMSIDVNLNKWWAVNDMPLSYATGSQYRRLWVYRNQLSEANNITIATRLVRKLPALGRGDALGGKIAPEVADEARALYASGMKIWQVAGKLGLSYDGVGMTVEPVRTRERHRSSARARSRRQRQALAEKRKIENEGRRALAVKELKGDPDLSKAYAHLRQAMQIVDGVRQAAPIGERRDHLTTAYSSMCSAEGQLVRAMRSGQ